MYRVEYEGYNARNSVSGIHSFRDACIHARALVKQDVVDPFPHSGAVDVLRAWVIHEATGIGGYYCERADFQ